jgi:hypothetical protein
MSLIDQINALDRLHEQATQYELPWDQSTEAEQQSTRVALARAKFEQQVFDLWPDISDKIHEGEHDG